MWGGPADSLVPKLRLGMQSPELRSASKRGTSVLTVVNFRVLEAELRNMHSQAELGNE